MRWLAGSSAIQRRISSDEMAFTPNRASHVDLPDPGSPTVMISFGVLEDVPFRFEQPPGNLPPLLDRIDRLKLREPFQDREVRPQRVAFRTRRQHVSGSALD